MRSNNFRRTEAVLYKYGYIKTQKGIDEKTLHNLLPDAGRSLDFGAPAPSNKNVSDPTYIKWEEFSSRKNYIAELEAAISKAENTISKIDKVLSFIEPTERKIIELKYFSEKKDFQVIMELSEEISGATYYRLKNEVINRFSLMLWGQGIDE